MSAADHTRLKRFLDGFSRIEDMQEPPGPDGDPQLAALIQFFQTLAGTLGTDDVILDIGSGRGILAHAILRIWPADAMRPWYFAVDQESVLDTLSLPPTVHNHSQKVAFGDLVAGRVPCRTEQIRVVVVRNVLHHLDIKTTAELLMALGTIVQAGGQVYVQDIVSLAKGERENAGWPSDLLCTLLDGIGFDTGTRADHRSRSGTEWFTIILKRNPGRAPMRLTHTMRLVADGREQQRQRRTTRLAELGDGQDTVPEYIILSTEVAALTMQLQQYHYSVAPQPSSTRVVADVPLLALPPSALDYAEEMPHTTRARTGLYGILSSKNLIDLPLLLRGATSRLWFAGYSQRLLFTFPEVRASLLDAATRGVEIRILLVDPESPAAVVRSISEAYADPNDFFDDIRSTQDGFAAFEHELHSVAEGAEQGIRCDLRFTSNTFSSSFFFVDDLCICSLYSADLTGGAGTAFIFRSSSVQPNGYFQVLRREFQQSWGPD